MTTPPLDLTALRRDIVSAAKCQPGAEAHPWEYVDPDHLIEVIDRVEYLERQLDAADRQIQARSGTTAAERIWITRAEAAEATIERVREAVGRYYVIDGHVCDDMDDPCAHCVADEAMDALGGQECPDCAHPHSVTRCAGAACDCCEAITALDGTP